MDTIQNHFWSLEKAPVNEKILEDDGRDGDEIDRISNMPNEILCHILSFLPTKYAVATSILSTKWKNLFCFIPNLRLHLDDSLLLNQQSATSTNPISFMNFVDRLLNVTLSEVPSIYAFCLICQNFSDGLCISNWVSAALRLNAKRIDLWVRRLKHANTLFDSLFGCKIVSLNLFLNFVDHGLECRFNLPNLKILSIQFMKFKDANVLLEGCPMLEYLLVYNCYCYPGEKLRICIPSLRVLKSVNDFYCLEGEIELEAPKLEELNYRGFLANRYLAKKLKYLQIAQLELDQSIRQYTYELNEHASELIKVCSNVVKLILSEPFIIMLQLLPHLLPRFPNLITLAVKDMNFSGWELLPSLLECAPNLKNLLIKDGFDMECFENFKDSLPESLTINLSQRGEKGFLLEISREPRTIEPNIDTPAALFDRENEERLHELELLDLSNFKTLSEGKRIFEAVLPLLEHLTVFCASLDDIPRLDSNHLNSLERIKELYLFICTEKFDARIHMENEKYVYLRGLLSPIELLIEWSLRKAPAWKFSTCREHSQTLKKLAVNAGGCFASLKVLEIEHTVLSSQADDPRALFDSLPNLEEVWRVFQISAIFLAQVFLG